MPPLASLAAICLAALLPVPVRAQEPEAVLAFPMLHNGDFSLPQEPRVVPGGIPWWLQRGKGCALLELEGEKWLVTGGEGVTHQPVPAYAPLVEGLVVRGRVRGHGLVAIVDGRGKRAQLDCAGSGEPREFEWSGADIARAMGSLPVPRLSLELSSADGKPCAWTALEVLVPLPNPTVEALRAEVVETLHYCIDPWLERALDDVGPRETGLVCHLIDAVTGERLQTGAGGFHPLMDILLDAVEHEPDPLWTSTLERCIEDFLGLLFHPETGLPSQYDALGDRTLPDMHHELHVYFRFLLDVAERGPVEFRERSRAAAERLAESVLRTGVLPDGNVAALYRPRDGHASNETRGLRRLDMPAQMTRLAALNGDERLLDASRDAVATLLYTHYWPGTWSHIDPGFDDDFGHYGDRAGAMAACFPEEELFRRVVDGAWDKFRVLWPQAMRFGGSMAADQVRGWRILADYSALRPEIRAELDGFLLEAVHSHLRGQQYGNGAWGDVTYSGFNPKLDLQVGDFPGTPSNLLEGLADLYGRGLGPNDEELRALFTAVLRSSLETYGREYGLIMGMREIDGPNVAGGSIRIGKALTLMLAGLSD